MAEGNSRKKVLITGGAGLIGSVLIDRLGDRYEMSSLDLREAVGVPSHVASLDDLDAMQPAFEGIDAVVHLAADRAAYAEWDSVLPNNLVGTYNVFEASRREGVKRVIFASSNHATGGFYLDEPWSLVGSGQFDKLEADAYPLVDEDVDDPSRRVLWRFEGVRRSDRELLQRLPRRFVHPSSHRMGHII